MPKAVDVVGASILIFQIVGMLPNIKRQQGISLYLRQIHYRIVLIGRGEHNQFALFIDEPGPARPKAGSRSLTSP